MDLERAQQRLCNLVGAQFDPPKPGQLAAVSGGVLGRRSPVQGVRYRAPEHMSGWYLTTDTYDGDARSLTVEHVEHVYDLRPEVGAYLALPRGFRFDTGTSEAWFDAEVAAEEAE